MVEIKNDMSNKEKLISHTGRLIVITGKSGAGKDYVSDQILTHSKFLSFGLRRLVTCTDRLPRQGELHSIHYYFVSPTEMDRLHKCGELVETPLIYGSSRKATPREEFRHVLYSGQKLLWRIDPSLAGKVANGIFFNEEFSSEESTFLKMATTVLYVDASNETIVKRRKERDGEKYDENEYKARDEKDREIVEKFIPYFKIIDNSETSADKLINELEDIINIHINKKINI